MKPITNGKLIQASEIEHLKIVFGSTKDDFQYSQATQDIRPSEARIGLPVQAVVLADEQAIEQNGEQAQAELGGVAEYGRPVV